MVCCPLSGCDGYATAGEVTTRKARKEHLCHECHDPIVRGSRYEHASTLYDGSWSTFKTCLTCVEIRDHFDCGEGYVYGQLWSDIEENFFPDMAAGGVCIEGLSPAAKARMFELRLEWMFESELEVGGAIPPGYAVDKGGILIRVSDAPEMVSGDVRVRVGESSPSPADGHDNQGSAGNSGGSGPPE